MEASSYQHCHTMKVLAVYDDLHAANLACLNTDGVTGSGVGLRDGLVKYMSYPDSNQMDRIYVTQCTAVLGARSSEAEVSERMKELKEEDDVDEDDETELEEAENSWSHHYGD